MYYAILLLVRILGRHTSLKTWLQLLGGLEIACVGQTYVTKAASGDWGSAACSVGIGHGATMRKRDWLSDRMDWSYRLVGTVWEILLCSHVHRLLALLHWINTSIPFQNVPVHVIGAQLQPRFGCVVAAATDDYGCFVYSIM